MRGYEKYLQTFAIHKSGSDNLADSGLLAPDVVRQGAHTEAIDKLFGYGTINAFSCPEDVGSSTKRKHANCTLSALGQAL